MFRRLSFFVFIAIVAPASPAQADFDSRRSDNDQELLLAVVNDTQRYALQLQRRMLDPDAPPSASAGTVSEKDPEGRPRWFDGLGGVMTLRATTEPLVKQAKFENIERVAAGYSQEKTQAADGRSFYPLFLHVIKEHVDAQPSPEKYLREWRRKIPRSSIAATLEAERIYEAAWEARGGGFANTVKPEQWAQFYKLVGQADKVLDSVKKYGADDPYWGQVKILTSFHLSHGRRSYEESLKNAIAATRYDHSLYFSGAMNMTPKWGGSWEKVDAFARLAAAMTKERDGEAFYARVYWYISQAEYLPNGSIFKDTDVSWPLMKKGFEDLLARYPHSAWNLNAFAGFACLADDEATLRKLWPRIGAFFMPPAWPEGVNMRACAEKAGGTPL